MFTRLASRALASHELASHELASSGDAIRHALEVVRKHFGMEVAYVSEFVDGRAFFRAVDAPGLEHLIKVGDSHSLDDIYCRHILAGRLPELMPDTADHPLAQGLPITRAVPIGAHVSVPLRLKDGREYGMFCCLSPSPNPSLNQRDLQVMRAFAEMAAHQICKEAEAERLRAHAVKRIEAIMETRAFSMLYQPIFNFDPQRAIGYEALCRFAAEPMRTPDVWFEEAAQLGCAVPLELSVLRHALEMFQGMPDHLQVWANLSPDTILSGELPGLLRHWPAERLVLEMTEHAPVADYHALNAAIAPLRAAGARLAIDDAGAGFASMQHILHLRPDIIKLDMGLTRGIDADPARRALASALTFFASEIGSRIVAEGIETPAELETLRALGIASGQGYLLGRPARLPETAVLPVCGCGRGMTANALTGAMP